MIMNTLTETTNVKPYLSVTSTGTIPYRPAVLRVTKETERLRGQQVWHAAIPCRTYVPCEFSKRLRYYTATTILWYGGKIARQI